MYEYDVVVIGHGAAELIHAYPSYSDAVRQPAKKCYIDNLQNNFFLKLLKKMSPKKKKG